jgi:apolipoprotein N-acyltransferase
LKFFSIKSFARSRYPLAIVAGLLLAASFPKIGLAGFAWIAPGVMLAVALGTRGWERFRIGYVAGLAHYLASLYWLLLIPVKGFPILGWAALGAFLALFPATWVWLAFKIFNFQFSISNSDGAKKPWLQLASQLASRNWSQRTFWALGCAAIWVALEMLLARIFGGFPWNLLGASQYRILPLIQISSITGVYGVSFLIIWTSASLLNAISSIFARPAMRNVWMADIIFPLVAIVGAFVYGFHEIGKPTEPLRVFKLTLIQPSIPQTLIWDPDNDMKRFEELMRLSQEALTNETDVLVWPEAAIPRLLRYDAGVRDPILNLARSHRIWLIVGSDDAEPQEGSSDPKDAKYYNSSFLINPAGEIVARYRKRSLVIFGEYIPLEHSLPIVKWLTPVTGSFTPGDKAVSFEMTNLKVKTSVLICFEDNFPHLVREYVDDDTDFLVNLTNNGWFGEGAAQWQHGANAIFRAIENGVPLVRCSNNGLTCWVDRNGCIREIFRDTKGTIYGPGFITVQVPLAAVGEKHSPTFYNRYGDRFGWTCVGCAVILAVASFRPAIRKL